MIPFLFAFTFPLALTDAILEREDENRFLWLALPELKRVCSLMESPFFSVTLRAVRATAFGAFFTTTVMLICSPEDARIHIFAFPVFFPVSLPELVTETTFFGNFEKKASFWHWKGKP